MRFWALYIQTSKHPLDAVKYNQGQKYEQYSHQKPADKYTTTGHTVAVTYWVENQSINVLIQYAVGKQITCSGRESKQRQQLIRRTYGRYDLQDIWMYTVRQCNANANASYNTWKLRTTNKAYDNA